MTLIERLNRQGGLLTHKPELNYADDGSDPKQAAEAAKIPFLSIATIS